MVQPKSITIFSVSLCSESEGLSPDKRSMGFPFDRRFERITTLQQMLKEIPNRFTFKVHVLNKSKLFHLHEF